MLPASEAVQTPPPLTVAIPHTPSTVPEPGPPDDLDRVFAATAGTVGVDPEVKREGPNSESEAEEARHKPGFSDDGISCISADKRDFASRPPEQLLARSRVSTFVERSFVNAESGSGSEDSEVCMGKLRNAYCRPFDEDPNADVVPYNFREESISEKESSNSSEEEPEVETKTPVSRSYMRRETNVRKLLWDAPCPATSSRPASSRFNGAMQRCNPWLTGSAPRNSGIGAVRLVSDTSAVSAPAVILFMPTAAGGKPSLAKFLYLDCPVEIGRRVSKLADVNNGVLSERSVSRNHATLYYSAEEGNVYVRDLCSLHGTFVNGREIYSPTVLRSGDLLRFGQASDALAPFEVCIIHDLGTTPKTKCAPMIAPADDVESTTSADDKELTLIAEDASNGKKRSHDAVFSDYALDDVQERILQDLAGVERRVRRKITVTSAISSVLGGLIGGVSVGAALFGLSQLE